MRSPPPSPQSAKEDYIRFCQTGIFWPAGYASCGFGIGLCNLLVEDNVANLGPSLSVGSFFVKKEAAA